LPIEEFAFCLHAKDVTGGHWYLSVNSFAMTTLIASTLKEV